MCMNSAVYYQQMCMHSAVYYQQMHVMNYGTAVLLPLKTTMTLASDSIYLCLHSVQNKLRI
jgi:hypothetical protein